MAASPRRVGAETSKTRDVLIDSVERLMSEEGYASVTYRAVAAKAGVTPSLVQYYFPTLDDIFLATIRRRTDRNVTRLTEALEEHPDDPLRVLWQYSWAEATGALITEFMALGNHRKSIRAEIAEVTEKVRRVQLEALERRFAKGVHLPEGRALARRAIAADNGHSEIPQPRRGNRRQNRPWRGGGSVRALSRSRRAAPQRSQTKATLAESSPLSHRLSPSARVRLRQRGIPR